jgi:hypothetical protein
LPPAVTISGGGGTGALAMASVNAAGAITGLTLTTAGTGYGSIPTVSIAAPTSIAASGTATLSGGTVSAVALTSGGTYSGTAPTVSFSAAPAGAAAVITPTLISVSGTTYLTALTITSPGSGYQAAPAISLSSACGGTGTTTLNANGGIASITLTGIGIGGTCAAADTVVLSTAPVAGVIAAATATLDSTGATVIGVTITNPGSGYATAPTVSFSGGVQATASAAVTGGGYGATAVAIASTTQVFITPAALPGNAVPPTPNATPVTLTGSVAALLGCSATSCSNLSNAMVGRLQNPAIQELFEPFYGRMNATLGVEMPNQSLQVQTTLPLNYVDPGTEMWEYNQPVMWKITHNGVDAHPVHFHLLNVQVVNRVGWDGTIKAPEDDEIGWKETVKMNPLEDVIVVMRPTQPQVPFGLDRSIRADDPSQPLGVNTGFTQYSTNGISGTNGPLLSQQSLLGKLPDGSGQTAPSPAFINAAGIAAGVGGPATVVNALENFDNEYVWHCHILGHEENDFMRAISVLSSPVAPAAPTAVAAAQTATGAPVVLTWVDATPIAAPSAGNGTFGNPANELGFKVLRSVDNVNWTLVAQVPANATTAIDPLAAASGTTYYYQVVAYNAAGSTSTPVTYKGL